MSMVMTDWPYWEKMKGDPVHYQEEKERILDTCIRSMDQRYPGLRGKVEASDVATPLTYNRYTGNRGGVYMTWMLSGEFQRKHPFVPKTVPGLDNFYLASMWTSPPGGLPGAAGVGRAVIQLLCARERKRFVATTP